MLSLENGRVVAWVLLRCSGCFGEWLGGCYGAAKVFCVLSLENGWVVARVLLKCSGCFGEWLGGC